MLRKSFPCWSLKKSDVANGAGDFLLEEWTTAKFKDEFFLCLSKFPDENLFISKRKYYALAKEIIYKIPIYTKKEIINKKAVFKPNPPPFVINLSDLTPRVTKELKEFIELNNEKEVNYLLKEIATKFFEAINYDYTHISLIKLLKVRLEK